MISDTGLSLAFFYEKGDCDIMKKFIVLAVETILWLLLNFITFSAIVLKHILHGTIPDVIPEPIYIFIYRILPILILIMPLVMSYFFKKVKKYSLIVYAVYICVIIIIHITVFSYMSSFTPHKWDKYRYERHLMLDDFHEKYDLKTMTKDELISILGKPGAESEDEIEYTIMVNWLDAEILVFRFEDDRIVEEYTYSNEFKSHKLKVYDIE